MPFVSAYQGLATLARPELDSANGVIQPEVPAIE
jgi:hypothetical protein